MGSSRSHQALITAQLKSQLRTCLRRAMRALAGKRIPSPESVHNARKLLKEARAILRLLRHAIGEREYRRENRGLRNVARSLSGVRDAQIVMVTFDRLVATRRSTRAFKALRPRLARRVMQARRAVLDAPTRTAILVKLGSTVRRIRRYRTPSRDTDSFKNGMRRLYRKGRKSFKYARSEPADESFHEARKDAKYLSLALGVLQSGGVHVSRRATRHARAVARLLGQDHDLAVLIRDLDPLLRDAPTRQRGIRRKIVETRKKVRSRALRAGRLLYKRKPRAFVPHCIEFGKNT